MALSFPRPLGQFWNTLRLIEAPLNIDVYQSTSGTRGGEVLTAEIAEPKWRMDVALAACTNDDADVFKGRINALVMRGSGGTFLARDVKRDGPRNDPTGSVISGSSPAVLGLSGRSGIRFTGLPAGYVISVGDRFSVSFGSNPVRYAFMEAAEGVTANGGGQTSFIDVTPFVKVGVTAGMAVTFVNPVVKMMIQPGSFSGGSVGLLHTSGMGFTAIEAF